MKSIQTGKKNEEKLKIVEIIILYHDLSKSFFCLICMYMKELFNLSTSQCHYVCVYACKFTNQWLSDFTCISSKLI